MTLWARGGGGVQCRMHGGGLDEWIEYEDCTVGGEGDLQVQIRPRLQHFGQPAVAMRFGVGQLCCSLCQKQSHHLCMERASLHVVPRDECGGAAMCDRNSVIMVFGKARRQIERSLY